MNRCPACGYPVDGELIDSAGIQRRYGVNRGEAEAWMRKLTKVQVADVRRNRVYLADVERLVRESERAA